MGNTCFSARTHQVERKFSEGIILRPCKKHCHLTYDKKGKGKTALIDAMEKGHLTCVTALVEAGADVNEKSTHWGQKTPLHCHPVHLGLSWCTGRPLLLL